MPVLMGLALACGSTGPPPPPAGNQMEPTHAPTPFSAEEIRRGLPDGSWVRFELTGADGATTFMEFRFEGGDPEGATVVTTLYDADERSVAPPSTTRSTWRDLQSHASFPRSRVRVTPGTFDTFRGPLEGWRYEVTTTAEGKVTVSRYVFARDLPGPPVLLEATVDGTLVQRMTMVGRGGPHSGPP